MFRILLTALILTCGSIGLAANTPFHCLISLAQQTDFKDIYNVEGEQNPPMIEFDPSKETEKTYFFKTFQTGNYIHGLTEAKSDEAILRVKLNRVITNRPDLGDGVRIELNTSYGWTYAGLGMRDSYKTYVQSITAELMNKRKGLILINCTRY